MYCPECGYCQGMGSLAATFLCYMLPEVRLAFLGLKSTGKGGKLTYMTLIESICRYGVPP